MIIQGKNYADNNKTGKDFYIYSFLRKDSAERWYAVKKIMHSWIILHNVE